MAPNKESEEESEGGSELHSEEKLACEMVYRERQLQTRREREEKLGK